MSFVVEMTVFGGNELFREIYKELFKVDPPRESDLEDIKNMKDPTFKKILDLLEEKGRLGLLKEFVYAPAAKSHHGAYIHGLLSHSVEMFRLSEDIERRFLLNSAYQNKQNLSDDVDEIDFWAIRFMCLIHDFYKINEYVWDEVGNIDYAEKPDVFGHDLNLSFKILNLRDDDRFQDELTIKRIERLAFIAAQHHGEWSEFKPAKMRETHREGELFHLIDMLESRLVSYIEE
jgi:3'-5' exoribonuclease